MAHSPSSSSSSSSTYQSTRNDVFLSCGEDAREFTHFLYRDLLGRRIHSFHDYELDDEIAFEEAIQTCRFAIIVLSKNFASSWKCLDRLPKILQHFMPKVYPIFHQVDPDDVRMLRGTYGEAMAAHKERFEQDRLEKWTMALQELANLPNFLFVLGDEHEDEYEFLIEKIVHSFSKNILFLLSDYPVGLEPRVQKVIQLLDLESGGGVHMIGIYGIPGMGKTTLAKAVHNSIVDQFELVCYLQEVRQASDSSHGLIDLQKTLLFQIVFGKDEDVVQDLTCLSEGIAEIRRRLCGKKVLLILDDVNKLEQLEVVAGGPDWFGPGSRVMITTQNQHLLVSHGIERRYKVNELNEKEALDLLTWTAFNNTKADSSYVDLLNRIVTNASGNPLQLEVIGSYLYGREVAEWKSLLSKLEHVPLDNLHKILKRSFDDLESMEQCVFLDIACCFKGYPLVEVQYMLHAHYSYCVTDYIRALIDKSLINISSTGKLTLQDNIRRMGREIVRRESPKEPSGRSRLCILDDIFHVLEVGRGTDNIEMICLDFFSREDKSLRDGEGFKNMGNLKTLIIKNSHFSLAPRHLPTSLRVLEWKRCPFEYLLPNFHPENLAMCKLPKHCFVSSEICGLLNKKHVNLVDMIFDDEDHSNEMFYVSCLPNSEKVTVREVLLTHVFEHTPQSIFYRDNKFLWILTKYIHWFSFKINQMECVRVSIRKRLLLAFLITALMVMGISIKLGCTWKYTV